MFIPYVSQPLWFINAFQAYLFCSLDTTFEIFFCFDNLDFITSFLFLLTCWTTSLVIVIAKPFSTNSSILSRLYFILGTQSTFSIKALLPSFLLINISLIPSSARQLLFTSYTLVFFLQLKLFIHYLFLVIWFEDPESKYCSHIGFPSPVKAKSKIV